jgi:hypothetical protein
MYLSFVFFRLAENLEELSREPTLYVKCIGKFIRFSVSTNPICLSLFYWLVPRFPL